MIASACRAPKDLGVARNTWTHESLREVLVRKRLVRRISISEVGRILGEADLKPHRVKGWCHSSDPDFQVKMRTIVALYVRRPAGTPVLSVDEKTGIQALSRARELQPRVHVILDNLNTHKDTSMGAFLSEWNRRHGSRFVFTSPLRTASGSTRSNCGSRLSLAGCCGMGISTRSMS